jgi:hypothetical protein
MKAFGIFVFSLLGVIVIGLYGTVGLSASFPTLEVSPSSVTVCVGGLFTVDVVVSDVLDLFM